MATVYLALGSNLGDRHQNITTALNEIKELGIRLIKQSSFIETKPVGGPPQGDFLNGVIKINTDISPSELLKKLQTIEKKMGRVKTVVDGPRTIDIDILLYDSLKIKSPELTIPHPRMFERDFVMRPLHEIDPTITEDSCHAID